MEGIIWPKDRPTNIRNSRRTFTTSEIKVSHKLPKAGRLFMSRLKRNLEIKKSNDCTKTKSRMAVVVEWFLQD